MSNDEQAAPREDADEPGKRSSPPDAVDDLSTTHHTLRAGDRTLAYTAQTGRIVLREEVFEDGEFRGHQAKAEVFVTSYVLDGGEQRGHRERPVVFAFNGGPGSSSVWLHLGLLGPRRVLMGDAGNLLGPPYELADNAETLLAHADLIFIDPVTTGYSRTINGGKPEDYHGYTRDLESVGEVIRLWTTRHGRWLSPKFLAGESYGTLRAAGLAGHLQQRHGLYLNGIVLISSVLDMGTIRFTEGNDAPYALFVPTYAAIAHHHGRHGDRPLADVVAQAEEFASRDYPWALARGHRLTDEERSDVVRRLAAVTGLSPEYVDRVELRVEHHRFFTELLRDEGRTVGRLDGRFTGWDADRGRERYEQDASYLAILGPYTAAFNHYVRAELEYENDLPYEILTGRVQPWSYQEFEGRGVSAASSLSGAMRANPHLKVHVACGYHDGATAYFAAEHVVAHLQVPAELRENVELRYYEAGHMMYIHEPSRLAQSADLADFIRASSGRG